MRNVLHEAARFAKGRRDFGPTGGPSGTVEQLVKSATVDNGYIRLLRKAPQIPLAADLIAEPGDDNYVSMQEALPVRDANYYALESNVIS